MVVKDDNTANSSKEIEETFNLSLYEKISSLGKGSFGTVFKWKLKDATLESHIHPLWIAVKEVIPHEEGKEKEKEQHKAKLKREHYILKGHPHKNIVTYLGRVENQHLKVTSYVMELCTTNLRHFSNNRKFSDVEIAIIMRDVLMALDHLHRNNIMHRDIKPENILIDIKVNKQDFELETVSIGHLTMKLCDFGLSRKIWQQSTMSLSTVGSPGYLAPEVRRDYDSKNPNSHYTASSDIFSAGVVAHEMRTGSLEEDVRIFTDFSCLETSLGENCDQNLLSMLKNMLHGDKRKRKSPQELLSHPFIRNGEQFLKTEMRLLESETQMEIQRKREEDLVTKTMQLESDLNDASLGMDQQMKLHKTERKSDKLKLQEMTYYYMVLLLLLSLLSAIVSFPVSFSSIGRAPLVTFGTHPDKDMMAQLDMCARLIAQQTVKEPLELLVESYIAVNDQLWLASKDGHIESMEDALKTGAQLEYKRDNYLGPSTALHVAAKNGHLAATKLLLKEGANVNAVTEKLQYTALMFAAMHNHLEVTLELLQHGANVNMKDLDGQTALHMAAEHVSLPIVKLLVEVGKAAEVNVKDNDGKTPLSRVIEGTSVGENKGVIRPKSATGRQDRISIKEYLKKHGATR